MGVALFTTSVFKPRPLNKMGGTKRFPFPQFVWSPSGGWWCEPRHWRRNTAIALAFVVLSSIPVAYLSSQLERRPVPPYRRIPSQWWCKYAKMDDPRLQ